MPKKHPIHALSDQLVEELCDLDPEAATYAGIPGRDHRWSDLSPSGADTYLAALRTMEQRIEALPPATDRWDQLAIDVASDYLRNEMMFYENNDHLRQLNSISSPLQGMREVFDHMKKDSVAAWDDVADRLETLDAAMTDYRGALEEGRIQGFAVPRRQVTEAIRQANVTGSDQSQFAGLTKDLAEAGIDDDGLAQRIAAGIERAKGAYRSLADYLETTYLPDAAKKDAAGRERHLRNTYRYIGMELDPEETYAWGWTEIAVLWERMAIEADKIAPGSGVAGALDVLKSDPERAAHDEQALQAFLVERIDEALDRLSGTHFNVPDEIRRCDVKIAPPGGSLGAYYVPPSEDFSRAGSVWWSIDRSMAVPYYDEVSTAYHEGFPGHHLQCGVQVGLRDKMTRLQRVWVWMPGSGEGWALYAERLMDELGFLDKPDYVFGFLTSQMLRACRVVVDIGSHLELPIPEDQPFHPGEEWSFDLAVEMLMHYATLDEPYAISEVNRYLGWPAQAISYKVGERAILDIRSEAQSRLGDAFDAKDFHQRLLEVGPFGLDLVRRYVLDT